MPTFGLRWMDLRRLETVIRDRVLRYVTRGIFEEPVKRTVRGGLRKVCTGVYRCVQVSTGELRCVMCRTLPGASWRNSKYSWAIA